MKRKITLFISALTAMASSLSAQTNEGGIPAGITHHLLSHVVYVNMPAFNLQQMQAEDAINDPLKGWWRFGFNHEVALNQQNSGAEIAMPDGGRLWLLGIHSAGALSLNLAFRNFNLPQGAKMFVYRPDGTMIFGAFTSASNQQGGEFATDLLLGESLIIEYYEPQEVAHTGTFELFRVTHAYRGVADYVSRDFGDAGICQVNVACPVGAPWANEIRSVCILVSGGNGFCSGALVNNVRQDGTPYVLTANHCGSSGFGTWVFRFNWQSATCSNPPSPPSYNFISGSIQVAANAHSDFSLVRMNTTPPANYNVYYSGWSNLNVTVPNVTGIHHPSADIKKISFATGPTITMNAGGVDCWQVGPWTTGTTEGGSSGSPAYDPNHHIIGQLYAGTSACGAPQSQQYDVYGKFSSSWGMATLPSMRLKDWLDPDNTCATILDGYDPNIALPVLDAEIMAIQSPVCNSSLCTSSITPSVKLRNRGTNTLTSVDINYKLDANPINTFAWTGSLAASTTTSINLPAISPSAGAHTYTVYTDSPNSSTDLNLTNDTVAVSFTILSPSTVAIPITQPFSSSAFPPPSWTTSNPDSSITWIRHSTISSFGSGFGCAYITNFSYGVGIGQSDYLFSPHVNFSGNAAPLRIYFDLAYARRNSANHDSLIVSYSLDCGFSWTRIYNKGDAALASNGGGFVTTSFIPTSAQWKTDSINLDFLAGQPNVKFRFENKSGNGNNLFLDNIRMLQGTIVGIPELIEQNSFVDIFPNPSNGNIQIVFNNTVSGTVTLGLYNSYGQKVFSEIVDAKESTLNENFSTLPKGVYFLHVSGENNSAVRKIVLAD